MIWQDDKPVDLFWCSCGRHCSGAAIGFETVNKSAVVSEDAGSRVDSYRDTEGHIVVWKGVDGRRCYTVSAGVMYRADFSYWGPQAGVVGECRYGKIPFLRGSYASYFLSFKGTTVHSAHER